MLLTIGHDVVSYKNNSMLCLDINPLSANGVVLIVGQARFSASFTHHHRTRFLQNGSF